ncbi:MAG TPA: hypothetical protein VLH37_08885 [Bacteroidales bacterium]|nr:hypothetical protein [Bacteroidales bacterium]
MKLLLTLLLSGLTLLAVAQDVPENQSTTKPERSHFSISAGIPTFVDAFSWKRTFSLSLGFQYRFLRSFAIEPFYLYAQNNDFPDFFDDKVKLDLYIRDNIRMNKFSEWKEIFLHSFGARLHFAFINNPRWYFTFNFAMGYYVSESASHFLTSMRPSYPFDYIAAFHQRRNSGWFSMPGLMLKRNLGNRFSLGIHLTGYFFRWPENGALSPADMPVLPEHWNASITFGRAF